jgi:hypothetical protein
MGDLLIGLPHQYGQIALKLHQNSALIQCDHSLTKQGQGSFFVQPVNTGFKQGSGLVCMLAMSKVGLFKWPGQVTGSYYGVNLT